MKKVKLILVAIGLVLVLVASSQAAEKGTKSNPFTFAEVLEHCEIEMINPYLIQPFKLMLTSKVGVVYVKLRGDEFPKICYWEKSGSPEAGGATCSLYDDMIGDKQLVVAFGAILLEAMPAALKIYGLPAIDYNKMSYRLSSNLKEIQPF